jgi:hypothetical protein
MTESIDNETIETRHKKLGYVSYVYAIIVLSSWYEELKVTNSAFYNVGWQRRAVQGHRYRRSHCA